MRNVYTVDHVAVVVQLPATFTRHQNCWFLGRSDVDTVKVGLLTTLFERSEVNVSLFATCTQYGPAGLTDQL